MRPDAERRHDGHLGAGERLHRGAAKVIVVVVREDDDVDGRELVERRRDGVKALRPDEAERRGAVAEHGVGEDAPAIELEEDRAVPEPGRAKPGIGAALPDLVRALERQRAGRVALRIAKEVFANQGERIALETGRDARRVPKGAVGELLGGAHALEARPRAGARSPAHLV